MTPSATDLIALGQPSPLRSDSNETIRIGSCRITLDLVVEQYENGLTPEDIVRTYEALDLSDTYAAIAFYLRHRESVRAYLNKRDEAARTMRAKIESEHPPLSRAELLARRRAPEGLNGSGWPLTPTFTGRSLEAFDDGYTDSTW
jgi:uncharacterized protein (DUF433 family)